MWLSLVERCVRDAEAGGSNPLTPTELTPDGRWGRWPLTSESQRPRDWRHTPCRGPQTYQSMVVHRRQRQGLPDRKVWGEGSGACEGQKRNRNWHPWRTNSYARYSQGGGCCWRRPRWPGCRYPAWCKFSGRKRRTRRSSAKGRDIA